MEFSKRQTLEYKWEINKPVEATLSDLDLTSLQSFILPFQRNLAPALLWTGKVLSGLGWRDSGKSCTGWQWAKLEEKGREGGVATHHLLPNGAKPCNPHLHPLPNLLLWCSAQNRKTKPQYLVLGKILQCIENFNGLPFKVGQNHIQAALPLLLPLFVKWSPSLCASDARVSLCEDKCVGVIVCNPWLSPALTADLHKCGRSH